MRGFRSTLVLLVVFLGLLGYFYFFAAKTPPGGKDDAGPKGKVFTVDADKIEELQVKAAGGDRTTLKKLNGIWSVVAPVETRADETEATAIATNLASLEQQRVVDENPADVAQYGLATPRVEVGFRKTGDKELTQVWLGEKTPTGNDIYAKLPAGKAVFLVSSFLDSTFNKTTFDLRDKRILAFDRDKVSGLEITTKDGPLSLGLVSAQWQLTKPIAAKADGGAADGAVSRLQTAQMKSIVAADVPEKDLAKYGLDKPAVIASVVSGSAKATLAIGKAADGGDLYARDMTRPMVFTVEATLAADLEKKADDYRPKDVFEFKSYNATRIEITRGTATVVYERVKGKDGSEKWGQVNPSKDVDQPKVEAVLTSLTAIQVDKYVDAKTKTGLETPVMTVTATSDGGKKVERVTFGKVGSDVFAARKGDPGALQITAAKLDDVQKVLDALK